jgi:hypothetical protein
MGKYGILPLQHFSMKFDQQLEYIIFGFYLMLVGSIISV